MLLSDQDFFQKWGHLLASEDFQGMAGVQLVSFLQDLRDKVAPLQPVPSVLSEPLAALQQAGAGLPANSDMVRALQLLLPAMAGLQAQLPGPSSQTFPFVSQCLVCIRHNRGVYPQLVVRLETSQVLLVAPQYPDLNTVVVTFSTPQSGTLTLFY